MRKTLLFALLFTILSLPAFGASSFLGGFSGNILTPDAVIEPTGTWELAGHQFVNVLGDGNDLTAVGLTYGLTPNLEVGASFLDNSSSEVAFNGKYRLLDETATRPALIVGAFDVAGSADFLSEDPGLFVVISKNITPYASRVAGEPSRPLRLSAGIGAGFLDGFFAGLDWTLEPRLSVMAEFFGGELGGNDNFFSAGARWAASDMLRLDVATIDFNDFAFGASIRSTFK